jgi:hypothetical protein
MLSGSITYTDSTYDLEGVAYRLVIDVEPDDDDQGGTPDNNVKEFNLVWETSDYTTFQVDISDVQPGSYYIWHITDNDSTIYVDGYYTGSTEPYGAVLVNVDCGTSGIDIYAIDS